MVVYVQSVVGKEIFYVTFKDSKRIDTSKYFLLLVFSREEVGKGGEYSIADIPKQIECKILPVKGYPVDE